MEKIMSRELAPFLAQVRAKNQSRGRGNRTVLVTAPRPCEGICPGRSCAFDELYNFTEKLVVESLKNEYGWNEESFNAAVNSLGQTLNGCEKKSDFCDRMGKAGNIIYEVFHPNEVKHALPESKVVENPAIIYYRNRG